MQSAGWPDILAWRDGVAYAFEVKLPGGKATSLQEKRLEDLRKVGVIAAIVESVEEVLSLLQQAKNPGRNSHVCSLPTNEETTEQKKT